MIDLEQLNARRVGKRVTPRNVRGASPEIRQIVAHLRRLEQIRWPQSYPYGPVIAVYKWGMDYVRLETENSASGYQSVFLPSTVALEILKRLATGTRDVFGELTTLGPKLAALHSRGELSALLAKLQD